MYPLYALNCKSFNDARRIPRFEFDTAESEDINSFGEGLGKLVDIGFQIPLQWAQDKMQIPVAAVGEAVLSRGTIQTEPAEPPKSAVLSAGAPVTINTLHRDPDDLIDELEPTAEEYESVIDPMLKPIVEAIRTGGYEYAQTRLAELYQDLDDDALEQMLTRALFVSDLIGRLNANH